MRGTGVTALAAAFVLLAAPGSASSAPERYGPLEPLAWQAPVPLLDPVAELQKRGATPKDMLASVLMPGLGELRTGRRNRAIGHIAAEAAIWTGFVVLRIQGELRKNDYVEYARIYAGVQAGGKQGDGYYRSLARYRRSDPGPNSYNEKEVREVARTLFPDDLDARKEYIAQHEIHGGLAWSWESDENWRSYRDLRTSSERSYQRSRFCIAAAIGNRIASVLGLARSRGPGGTSLDFGMGNLGGDLYPTPTVSISKRF
jgi:hypothetical protein